MAEVIAFGVEAATRLAEVENRDALLVELTARQAAEAEVYRQAAGVVTKARIEAAKRLETQAVAQINDLAMNARFHIEVTPEADSLPLEIGGVDYRDRDKGRR